MWDEILNLSKTNSFFKNVTHLMDLGIAKWMLCSEELCRADWMWVILATV